MWQRMFIIGETVRIGAGWRSSDKLLVPDWKQEPSRGILNISRSASSLQRSFLCSCSWQWWRTERGRDSSCVRNRFYGARGRNCAGMESRAMECETVVVTALSPLSLFLSPSVYFRVFCLHSRKFFDERGEWFSLSRDRAREILEKPRTSGSIPRKFGWMGFCNKSSFYSRRSYNTIQRISPLPCLRAPRLWYCARGSKIYKYCATLVDSSDSGRVGRLAGESENFQFRITVETS